MSVKTNKSIRKRIRLTRHGKFLISGRGMNHFQAKKKRSVQLHKKLLRSLDKEQTQRVQAYLYH